MFYLAEGELNIIGMDDNVVGGVRYLEVVCPDQDLLADVAKLAVEFQTVWGGSHGIDRDGIPVVFA
jgi:hypothetical protein